MQIINQIGHLQHWGLSPAANFLSHFKTKEPECVRVLISGASDIRHILKTLTDIDIKGDPQPKKIEIYFHETQKQLLCRALLFLHIIHEVHLNFQERIELFLDIYGNANIKERNSRYLHNLRIDLLNLIHSEKKILTPIKNFISFKLLKFQQRDEMSEIVQSWSNKVQFDIAKQRDQRLRFMFKERYDYRSNLIDWDYSMLLSDCAPILHFYHYKEWRLNGLAFQQRFSTYCEPNRTLSSYAPGKKKQEKTSCLVRGYWGDMICSPYIAMGVDTNSQQKQLLFKKANMKHIGHSVELTEYNLHYWLHRIELNETYEKHFRDYYRTDEEGKKKLEEKQKQKKEKKMKKEKQLKEIKEEGEGEGEQEIKEKEEQNITKQEEPNILDLPKKEEKGEELDSDDEQRKRQMDKKNAEDIKIGVEETGVLSCFKKYGIEFHLMANPVETFAKPKFKEFFDIIVLGFIHSAYLAKGIQETVKKQGQVYVEKARYIVPKKKQERKELDDKLRELGAKEGQFKMLEDHQDYFVFQKK